jgi:lysozyme
MTPEGQTKLIEHEDEVLHAYQDSKGFWTIGVGHLIDKRKGGGIPLRVSRILLDIDIATKTAECRAAFDWFDGLDMTRQDAIINLCFNIGIDNLKGFKNMIAAIQADDWQRVYDELLYADPSKGDMRPNSYWLDVGDGPGKKFDRAEQVAMALKIGAWD